VGLLRLVLGGHSRGPGKVRRGTQTLSGYKLAGLRRRGGDTAPYRTQLPAKECERAGQVDATASQSDGLRIFAQLIAASRQKSFFAWRLVRVKL